MALGGNISGGNAFWQQAGGTWEGITEAEYMSYCSAEYVNTALVNPARENICWLLTVTQSIREAITALNGIEISDWIRILLGIGDGIDSTILREAWKKEAEKRGEK